MATITVKAKPTTAEEKLEELFRQNSKLIYNAAFRITGNADDAEDVLQTIILRLMGRELSDELLAKPKGYWWQAA
ncbi:MAG TPA: sigma factor, partial [Terriglobia bacterium]